jgi:hypothetical protein
MTKTTKTYNALNNRKIQADFVTNNYKWKIK